MNTPRWKQRPPGSNWGDFGADDQLGRLNLITRDKLRQGLAEATEGIAFCLSLPLDYPGGNALNPRRNPPLLRPTVRDGRPNFNCTLEGTGSTDVYQRRSRHHLSAIFDAVGQSLPCRRIVRRERRRGRGTRLLQRLPRRHGDRRAERGGRRRHRWPDKAWKVPRARWRWASSAWPNMASRVAAS